MPTGRGAKRRPLPHPSWSKTVLTLRASVPWARLANFEKLDLLMSDPGKVGVAGHAVP